MYKHILIATDGSDVANSGVVQGLDLAKCLGAKATIITVTEPPGFGTAPAPRFLAAYEKAATEAAARILSSASDAANARGVPCATLHIKDHYAAEAIKAAAIDQGCDLIVMGSHGRRGLRSALLGNETMKVLADVAVPVLVCC
jgi:nucleotide-binding universal stress UspA family protein